MFCLFADSMASNAPSVAKLNAWKKAVKNSRHVTGSLKGLLTFLWGCVAKDVIVK